MPGSDSQIFIENSVPFLGSIEMILKSNVRMAKMIQYRPGRGREEGKREREKKGKKKRSKDPFLKWKIVNSINNPVSLNKGQEFIYKSFKVPNFQFKYYW